MHEEYLACFLSCVLDGTTSPEKISRPKTARILREKPALAARIYGSLETLSSGELTWIPEEERVQTVLLKLARGHIAYELSLPRLEEPVSLNFVPLPLMSPELVAKFLGPQPTRSWPEIGSRAFVRAFKIGLQSPMDAWTIVQSNRYQYLVSQSNGDFVRMLIGGYLACEVRWD